MSGYLYNLLQDNGGEEKNEKNNEIRSCIKLKDNKFVDAGNFKSFKKNQKGITVMCWFKTKDFSKNFHIINQGGGWDQKGWSIFWIDKMLRIELQNNVKVMVDNKDVKFKEGKFNHVAFSYNQKTIKVYANGKKLSVESNFTGDLEPQLRLHFGNNEITGNILEGSICEVKIFKNGLSKSEIKEQMVVVDDDVLKFENIIGYWNLNDNLNNLVNGKSAKSKSKFITYNFNKLKNKDNDSDNESSKEGSDKDSENSDEDEDETKYYFLNKSKDHRFTDSAHQNILGTVFKKKKKYKWKIQIKEYNGYGDDSTKSFIVIGVATPSYSDTQIGSGSSGDSWGYFGAGGYLRHCIAGENKTDDFGKSFAINDVITVKLNLKKKMVNYHLS